MLNPRVSIAWGEFAGLLGLMVGVWFLWNTRVILPLKILVVFFHELSHGLTALATGGRIVEIRLTADEGGLCMTAGGSRFLTLNAGYLGSLVWGGTILLLAAKTKSGRGISVCLGVLVLVVCAFWIRPLFGFGSIFAAVAGLALIAAGVFLSAGVNGLLNKVIGLTSCLYAVMDIKSDILQRPGAESDATMLAAATRLPAYLWGILWITIAAVAALCFLALATTKSKANDATVEAKDLLAQ